MKAIVEDKYEFDLSKLGGADITKNQDGTYHLIYQDKSYNIEPLNVNLEKKHLSILVEGQKFEIQLADEYDQLIEKLGFSLNAAPVFKNIKAPMPGLVLEIMVKPGDQVTSGDALLILEAMKMENVLKAPGDGIVKEVMVQTKDAIEKGAVLIEME